MFNDIPNVFGIADDILIAEFVADARDHDVRLKQMLWRWRQANLKLNKEKCLFRQTCRPFFGKIISRHRVSPDLPNFKALTNMLTPKIKRKLHSFLGIVNYLSKFSSMTAEVCEQLWRLTSVNVVWTWNRLYQKIYERAKSLVKEDVHEVIVCQKVIIPRNRCIRSSLGCHITTGERQPRLQIWWSTRLAFASKNLSGTDLWYSNIKREALRILHGLEKFHH